MANLKKSCLLNNLKASRSMMEEIECKLHKALYGLKQAPRAWYSIIDSHLVQCVSSKLPGSEKGDDADASSYRSLIGTLLYLTATRPYLMYAAGVLSRVMQSPYQVHMGAAKRVLRCVKGTHDYGIWYTQSEDVKLFRYADSD
ncbi:UNVERIFIED_CONTAM: hypothetical protein Sradi_5670900 [Sesamum radiatum]|uniref:Reverse transcriptase n=1 Tax=Sesamum radiatum TaxID=300843 RepID=A0AAW2L4E5_SESRA